jgi:hypothetical protein
MVWTAWLDDKNLVFIQFQQYQLLSQPPVGRPHVSTLEYASTMDGLFSPRTLLYLVQSCIASVSSTTRNNISRF